MSYRPPDIYLWDFWFAPPRQDEPFHVFHLQAPVSLGDPNLRHFHATIGHAVSDDLIHWTRLETAFGTSAPGAFDDEAIWTGSVLEWEDRWYCFYTGINKAENHLVQRISCAVSDDLTSWTRVSEKPILEAAGPWYVTRENLVRKGVDFRDPWVMRDPNAERFLMFYTAAAPGVSGELSGIIGLAESTDLLNWTLLPPVTSPGICGQAEVPQVFQANGRWYLLFCTNELRADWPGGPWTGTHAFVSDSVIGPYELLPDPPIWADALGSWYSARMIEHPERGRLMLAWNRTAPDGSFAGGLSDPREVRFGSDGRIELG